MENKRHSFNVVAKSDKNRISKLPHSKSLTSSVSEYKSNQISNNSTCYHGTTNSTIETKFESCLDSSKTLSESKIQSSSQSIYHDAKQLSILDIVKHKKRNNRKIVSCKYNIRLSNTISNLSKDINDYKKTKNQSNIFEILYKECYKINELIINAIGDKNSVISKNSILDCDKDDTLGDISSSFSENSSQVLENNNINVHQSNLNKEKILKKKITKENRRISLKKNLKILSKDNILYSFVICLNRLMSKVSKLQNPTYNLINQTNNNNDDNDTNNNHTNSNHNVSNHQYFRNAQLLLSNNSSQMQNIFVDKQSDKKRENFKIRSYVNGQASDRFDSSLEQQFKLNNRMSLPNESLINDDESVLDMIDDDSRPEIENSLMKSHRERQAQKRLDAQLHDYNKIRQHIDTVKSKNSCRNDTNYFNQSKESSCSNSCFSNNSDDTCTGNSNNSSSLRSCKKVSFGPSVDQDINPAFRSIEKNCNTNDYILTKLQHIEDNIQSFMVTTNNLTRRMNNLEVNFQEFSQLFVQLLEKSLTSNALMSSKSNINNQYE